MSATLNIKIEPEDGWTLIEETGFITANKPVEFLVSESTPDDSMIGHHLKTFGEADFTDESVDLYVKGDSTLIITPGSAFNAGGAPNPDGLFTGLRAMTVQSYLEANVKNGRQNEIAVYLSELAGGAVNDTLFVTGSLPVILKERTASYTGDGVLLEIFENATYSAIGTPLVSYNLTRLNPVTPESVFYSSPTLLTDGDLVFTPEYLIGNNSNQGNGGTNQSAGRERILKANTVYLFRVTSLDASTEDVWLFDSFYEGQPDLPVS